MKYYFDTEFNEDFHKPIFGRNRHFIDLISIGIVAEDDRTFYAISKDFDLKAAWNKYDLEVNKQYPQGAQHNKVYWLRENVLKPIFNELSKMQMADGTLESIVEINDFSEFTYSNMAGLLSQYGKQNNEIAKEIEEFCRPNSKRARALGIDVIDPVDFPEFYAYFADYDWVVFCSLFGSMMKLPKGFPMYCIDLKQMLDQKHAFIPGEESFVFGKNGATIFKSFAEKLKAIKQRADYPKQNNEHNALADAQWNIQLHQFIIKS